MAGGLEEIKSPPPPPQTTAKAPKVTEPTPTLPNNTNIQRFSGQGGELHPPLVCVQPPSLMVSPLKRGLLWTPLRGRWKAVQDPFWSTAVKSSFAKMPGQELKYFLYNDDAARR